MGYLDRRTNWHFKKREDGKVVFFPWSIRGKGYLLESQAQELECRSWVKRWNLMLLVALVVGLSLSRLKYGALSFGGFMAAYALFFRWRIKKLTSGLTKSDTVLTEDERDRIMAQAWGAGYMLFLALCAFFFALAGLWAVLANQDSRTVHAGWLAMGFFGLCGVLCLRQSKRAR